MRNCERYRSKDNEVISCRKMMNRIDKLYSFCHFNAENTREDGMIANRFLLAAAFHMAALFTSQSVFAALVAPTPLAPGGTVSPLPNGYSSSHLDPGSVLYDNSVDFDFDSGLLAGVLRDRVIRYSLTNEYHPYGGLYFDYEISLSSGDVTKFSVPGYGGYDVAVKQCGIPGCGGSGANGVSTTTASRSSDGNWISFAFGGDLSGTAHSANLQLLTNAMSFVDPTATLENAAGDIFSVPVVAPASVPETSTWAMMLAGFAGLGLAGFRGSRKSAALVG
jgi:hypothetical protein